jgi:acyl carrier protein
VIAKASNHIPNTLTDLFFPLVSVMSKTTSEQSIEQPVREFIAKNLLYSTQGFPYADDASLLREGIIDSLGVVELVEFTQAQFGVKVDQQEVIPDNFDSVARLAGYIRRKLGERQASAA